MDATKSAVLKPESGIGGRTAAGSRTLSKYAQDALKGLLAHWEVWPMVSLSLASVLYYQQSALALGLPFDDSYISLLFARNLADFGFLTFDGETASAGATSILHVTLLSVPIKLGLAPVRASVGLGVAAHVGLVLAVYWLSWTIFRDRLSAMLAAASVAGIGYLAMDALNGMETTLFLMLTTATAAAFLGAKSDRGHLAAGVLAALAVLTRPEGALLLAAMVLYYLAHPDREGRLLSPETMRRLAALAGPSAVALLALALFYLATTGSFTPGTATAKYLFFREFEWSFEDKGDMVLTQVANFVGPVLPWVVLAAFAARRRETLLFGLFWVAFVVLYCFMLPGGLRHYWYRYQHVFLPAIAVYGSAGLVILLGSIRPRSWEAVAAAVVAVVLGAGIWIQYEAFGDHYVRDVGVNETRQVGMALWLREVVPEGATIATHDIGTLGYYSDREVIDLVGLVNPDVIDYHDGRRLREYVDEVQPDYIVVFPSWERNFLLLGLVQDTEIFEEVQRFRAEGSDPFVLYKTHY